MSDYLVIAFPNLLSKGYQVTSSATTDYNCIAWAAGDDTRWWWPDGFGFGYWPPQSQRAETLDAFISAYSVIGYEPCADGLLEAGYDKIAIYIDERGKPTHAARQLPHGAWTSKLGEGEDIEHTVPEGVAGEIYGTVGQFLRRWSAVRLEVVEQKQGKKVATQQVKRQRDEHSAREKAEQAKRAENAIRESWEYKLACLQSGNTTTIFDPDIRRFARLLDKIQLKTRGDRKTTSDQIVRCKELLEEKKDSDRYKVLLSALQELDGLK